MSTFFFFSRSAEEAYIGLLYRLSKRFIDLSFDFFFAFSRQRFPIWVRLFPLCFQLYLQCHFSLHRFISITWANINFLYHTSSAHAKPYFKFAECQFFSICGTLHPNNLSRTMLLNSSPTKLRIACYLLVTEISCSLLWHVLFQCMNRTYVSLQWRCFIIKHHPDDNRYSVIIKSGLLSAGKYSF